VISSSSRTSSNRPGAIARTCTSSPGSKPAARSASTGSVTWFFLEIALTAFTVAANSKGFNLKSSELTITRGARRYRTPTDAGERQRQPNSIAPDDRRY
jgi:hypothetical protein